MIMGIKAMCTPMVTVTKAADMSIVMPDIATHMGIRVMQIVDMTMEM
jgi:hypothetical protein